MSPLEFHFIAPGETRLGRHLAQFARRNRCDSDTNSQSAAVRLKSHAQNHTRTLLHSRHPSLCRSIWSCGSSCCPSCRDSASQRSSSTSSAVSTFTAKVRAPRRPRGHVVVEADVEDPHTSGWDKLITRLPVKTQTSSQSFRSEEEVMG